MKNRSRNAVSESSDDVEALLSLPETALELVKEIWKVKISELWEEVQADLRLVHRNVKELHSNTTKVLNHISVCLDSIENSMQSAALSMR